MVYPKVLYWGHILHIMYEQFTYTVKHKLHELMVKKLKTNASSSSDDLGFILSPLTYIVYLSLSTSAFPRSLKSGKIVFDFKKNYYDLKSVFSKV